MGRYRTVPGESLDRMRTYFLKMAVLGISVVLVSLGQSSYAADSAGYVCASVLPCDEKTGVILPAFSDPSSPCTATYVQQCSKYQASLVGDELAKCEAEQTTTIKSVKSLTKQIRRLKKKLHNKS